MAKGFKAGGGGGAPLNFKVVGGATAPSNPKENTIWVNTDVDITSWLFSATEPSPAESGMVWIASGTSSTRAFNALKKNGIYIYPILARQYIGGAWVIKTAKIYQSGAWRDWFDGVIFRNGAKNDHITGGWNGYTSGTVLTLDKSHSASTKNYIDLTGFKRLYVTFASVSLPVDTASYGIRVFLSGVTGSMPVNLGAKTTGTLSADISSIDEPMMIKCDAHTYQDGGSGTISAIWCE